MKLMNDYSWIRGVCYGWNRPGSGKTLEDNRRELGYAKRLNINSTRIWLSYQAYAEDPEGFLNRLKGYVRMAWEEYGISTMPILWNGNGIDPAILEPEYWAESGDAYNTAVVEALKDEPGLIMWDVMNEPSCNEYLRNETDEEVKARKTEKMWNFVRHFCELTKKLDPDNPITVGHTFAQDVEPTIDCVDVISFHDYLETRSRITATYEKIVALSEKYNKPYINSELCCLCRSNPYDLALEVCNEYKAGWYVFELMIEGYWSDVHGIVYPDGTIRDPAIVAALFGFYRNKDLSTMVKPNPNKEGHVYLAIKTMEEALQEKHVLFKGERSNTDAILEACEYCANILECSEMVPMYEPPTANIKALRAQEHPDVVECRRLGYALVEALKKNCQIL